MLDSKCRTCGKIKKMIHDENIESPEISDNEEEDMFSEDVEPTFCLFCEETFNDVDEGIVHLKAAHSLDLMKLKYQFNMDQYSYIKLINFIRSHKIDPCVIEKTKEVLWNDEKYLKPLKYETWLTYDFEDIKDPLYENTVSESNNESLTKDEIIKHMTEQIEMKSALLRQATEDIQRIRKGVKRILKDSVNNNSSSSETGLKMKNPGEESYFHSYAHFDIHHEMLSDTVRTEAYRDAFSKNKSFVSGKTVLDIGSGTSILSMFASLAGASEVVGIDNSEIIYNAMEIIKKNHFQNITLIKGKIEDTSLPIEKFDIIVSEWMGYFLLFEGMLDSIIYGRENYLKPGGTLMPNRCTISLTGYGNEKRYDDYITFWDSVYSFDMSSIKSEVLREPSFEICDPEHILTEENCIIDYDLNTVSLNYSNFEYDFNLKCVKSGILTSFIGHFDTFFELPTPEKFSTSASSKPTHWKQTVFYLDEKVNINAGENVSGKIICRRSFKNLRSLIVKIEIFGKELNYHID